MTLQQQDDVISKAPPLGSKKETDEGALPGSRDGGSGGITTTSPGADSDRNLIEYGGQIALDPALEKRLRRKFDRTLIVLVFLAYMLAFLDRSNIGNARLAKMNEDLGFADAHFQWLLTIFYIPYILFEPCAVMWKLLPPHIWAAITVATWGLASTLQAAAFNWEGLMVCRWFLAMAEASFAPGVPYLLSFFYRRKELGLRIGIFFSAAPLATTFAGALAFAITDSKTGIAPWRLLFLVEGAPTILLAAVLFFYLPDSPETAKFLTPQEKEAARSRAILQSGTEGKARLGSIQWKEVIEAFESLQTVIPALMYFSCNVSFSSLPVFLPSILTTMGFSQVGAQGLTAPPYFLAFLVCIGTTYLADKTQQRGIIIMILSVIGGIGYILLAVTTTSTAVRYTGVFLAASGVFPAIANVLPWTLNNQGTDTKRGVGIAILNIIGQCGPLLGTRLFPESAMPHYTTGMATCAAFMVLNALLAAGLRWHFARKNKKLEEEEETGRRPSNDTSNGCNMAATKVESEMQGTLGYRYVL
ncbi:major facilitator superfamily domain-containing protein [Podospora australis]|uniref:Major facilitator superfamily domain-containing protein n=1 Tax=Podospora australis TaxID=1536484 RepID=A0AAN6WJ40_9PEZI|nr:major facilitator superfamily domain-containing protein [Podospora australis]